MKRLIIVTLALMLTACAQEFTRVGNPTLPTLPTLPTGATTGQANDSTLKLFTQDFLSKNAYQEGSSLNEAGLSIYLAVFGSKTVTIHTTDLPYAIELDHTINDDGFLATETDEESGFKITGTVNKASKDYPLDLNLLNSDGTVVSKLFTVVASADTEVDEILGKNADNKCFDSDGWIIGQHLLPGQVQRANGEIVKDECLTLDGKVVLAEATCAGDKAVTDSVIVYFECDCQNNKCLGDAKDYFYSAGKMAIDGEQNLKGNVPNSVLHPINLNTLMLDTAVGNTQPDLDPKNTKIPGNKKPY